MSTQLDIDIRELVGEMEAPPCEHSQHGEPGRPHDEGPATQYVQGVCDLCHYKSPIIPVCSGFVAFVLADGPMHCRSCWHDSTAAHLVRILGPVNA